MMDAINEFGWENVKHSFYTLPENKDLMYALEKWLIDYFDTTNSEKGYNSQTGGREGYTVRKELKDWHSKFHADYFSSEENRKKQSERTKQGMSDPKLRQYLSDCKKGKPAKNRKRVTIDGVEYESQTAAAIAIGHSDSYVNQMIKDGRAQYVE